MPFVGVSKMDWPCGNPTESELDFKSIPAVTCNEIELVISNFKGEIIDVISQLLQSGDPDNDIKRLHNLTIYSDWKELPNFKFRLMVFPVCPYSDGGVRLSDYKLSAYVEATPKPEWPTNWVCFGVHFCVFVINYNRPSQSVYKKDSFNFSRTDTDRGWRGIVTHAQMIDSGFLTPEGNLVLRAGVYPMGAEVDKASRDINYNSRNATGFVGLQNHGATCYMNALLQSLYSIAKFRKAVYRLDFDSKLGPKSLEVCNRLSSRINSNNKRRPRESSPLVDPDDLGSHGLINGMDLDADADVDLDELHQDDYCQLLMEENEYNKQQPSTSLALQNLFYKLHYSPTAPQCKELMQSFGWDSSDMFTQQDSHELLKLLLDKIEEQMKGTAVEGSVKQMFEGEMETFIECVNIDYSSVRKETFEDIQLDVQGCSDIYESLDRLVEAELLYGENMYEAEGHGKQEARKGIRILKFPPVVVFLLKRFTFDLQRMDTVKLNDKFEFYKEIDLTRYCAGAGKFKLQAVAVHVGSINSGHYYAMACTEGGNWYKFDDDVVVKVSEYAAIADNFGGEEPDCHNYLDLDSGLPFRRQKVYNAYILIYVKSDLAHEILGPVDPCKENPRMIQRCCMQAKIEKIQAGIQRRISQYIKLVVFQKHDYIGKGFLHVPFYGWHSTTPLVLPRSTSIHEALAELVSRINNTPGVVVADRSCNKRNEIREDYSPANSLDVDVDVDADGDCDVANVGDVEGDVDVEIDSEANSGNDYEVDVDSNSNANGNGNAGRFGDLVYKSKSVTMLDSAGLVARAFDKSELPNNFLLLGQQRHMNRFQSISQLSSRYKAKPSTLNDLVALNKGHVYQVYDPSLYLLYAPLSEADAQAQEAQVPGLLFIKVFDVSRLSEQLQACEFESGLFITDCAHALTCVDVGHLDLLEPLESGFNSKAVSLARDVARVVIQGPIDWYIELANGYQRINAQRPLAHEGVATGDVLIFNARVNLDANAVEKSNAIFNRRRSIVYDKEAGLVEETIKAQDEAAVAGADAFAAFVNFDASQVLEKFKQLSMLLEPFVHVDEACSKGTGIKKPQCIEAFVGLQQLWQIAGPLALTRHKLPQPKVYDYASLIDHLSRQACIVFKCFNVLQLLGSWKNVSNGPVVGTTTTTTTATATATPASNASLDEGLEPDAVAASEYKIWLDTRFGYTKALVHVCLKMGIDPAHVLVYPCLPLAIESVWSKPRGVFEMQDQTLCDALGQIGTFIKSSHPLASAAAASGSASGSACASASASNSGSMEGFASANATTGNANTNTRAGASGSARGQGLACENVVYMAVLPTRVSDFLPPPSTGLLRFVAQVFDHKINIVASCMGLVQATDTVYELCEHVGKMTGVPYQLRLVSVFGSFTVYGPTTPISQLPQYTNTSIRNYFAAPMRFEPQMPIPTPKQRVLTVVHQTPDAEFFGHPFQIIVEPTWTMAKIKAYIKDKLGLDKKEFDRWSFFQYDVNTKVWKSNDHMLDWDTVPDLKLLAEHTRPFYKVKSSSAMRI